MDNIEKQAREQALRHAEKFFDDDDNTWLDILEKYAEVYNMAKSESKKIDDRMERGAHITENDFADYWYYDHYHTLLAIWIANSELSSKGYEKDKHKYWILKKQPSTLPTKKKFGFWK